MKFLKSNETVFRLLRTIVQGVIGVIIANLDIITGAFQINDIWKPIIAATTGNGNFTGIPLKDTNNII